MEATADGVRHEKYSKWECMAYLLFLLNVTVMAVVGQGSDIAFMQSDAMQPLLVGNDNGEWGDAPHWNAVSKIEHFYVWFEWFGIPFLLNPEDDWYINGQRLLGGIRIRQVHTPHIYAVYT